MRVLDAHGASHLPIIQELFIEYAQSLSFDLGFQSFETELAGLPGRYAPPDGRLLLGILDDQPAGCVAVRKLSSDVCEMKRFWVRPPFRGRGMGRALAQAALSEAQLAGYQRMVLDTVSPMVEAIALYRKLGFRETAPYTHNPLPEAVFMEVRLGHG